MGVIYTFLWFLSLLYPITSPPPVTASLCALFVGQWASLGGAAGFLWLYSIRSREGDLSHGCQFARHDTGQGIQPKVHQNTPVASFVFHLFIKTDFDWSNRSENFWESVKNIKLNDCTSNEYANSVFLFLLFCLLFLFFLSYYFLFGLGSDNWGSLPWGAGRRIISRRSHPLSHLKHLRSASPHPR